MGLNGILYVKQITRNQANNNKLWCIANFLVVEWVDTITSSYLLYIIHNEKVKLFLFTLIMLSKYSVYYEDQHVNWWQVNIWHKIIFESSPFDGKEGMKLSHWVVKNRSQSYKKQEKKEWLVIVSYDVFFAIRFGKNRNKNINKFK